MSDPQEKPTAKPVPAKLICLVCRRVRDLDSVPVWSCCKTHSWTVEAGSIRTEAGVVVDVQESQRRV